MTMPDIPPRYWGLYAGVGALLFMVYDMWSETQ